MYRDDGKVLKGPNYKEADMKGLVWQKIITEWITIHNLLR
jgi:hypothetical protein